MKIVIVLTCLLIAAVAQNNPPQFTSPPNSYSTNMPQAHNPAMPGFNPGSMPTNSRPGNQPMTQDTRQSPDT